MKTSRVLSFRFVSTVICSASCHNYLVDIQISFVINSSVRMNQAFVSNNAPIFYKTTRLHKSAGLGSKSILRLYCLIKMRSGCIGPCRVVEMTAFVLFFCLFSFRLFCISVHSPFTLGHVLPKPSTLTHHVDHSPSFAVHPLKVIYSRQRNKRTCTQ